MAHDLQPVCTISEAAIGGTRDSRAIIYSQARGKGISGFESVRDLRDTHDQGCFDEGCKFASDFRFKRKATRSEGKFRIRLGFLKVFRFRLGFLKSVAFVQHKFLRLFLTFFAFTRANSKRVSSKNMVASLI